MFIRQSVRRQLGIRCASYGKPPPGAISNALKEKTRIKEQRDRLAKASLRDIFSTITGTDDPEEDFDLSKFDTAAYYANPKAYQKLSYFHRHYLGEDLRDRMKRNWKGLSANQKRFSYWLAYGSHGPREGFPNMYDYYSGGGKEKIEAPVSPVSPEAKILQNDRLGSLISQVEKSSESNQSDTQAMLLEHASSAKTEENKKINPFSMANRDTGIPPDLPFRYPSVLKTTQPTKDTFVTEQPALDPRSFGVKRLQQYQQDRRMNPYNQVLVAVLAVLTVLAFRQDRRVNLTGKVPEYGWEKQAQEAEKEKEDNENKQLSLQLEQAVLAQIK